MKSRGVTAVVQAEEKKAKALERANPQERQEEKDKKFRRNVNELFYEFIIINNNVNYKFMSCLSCDWFLSGGALGKKMAKLSMGSSTPCREQTTKNFNNLLIMFGTLPESLKTIPLSLKTKNYPRPARLPLSLLKKQTKQP